MAISHGICFVSSVPSAICFLNYGLSYFFNWKGTGGPMIINISYIISFVFEFLVALSFAEICSAFP